MASNSIVQVSVAQVAAPIPETLQQTGAIVSVGSTTLSPGTSQVITQVSDLTTYLKSAATLASITYDTGAGTATATATSPHGYTTGSVVELTIAGATPTAYNGTFQCLITGASTFIYEPASAPAGSASIPGGFTPEDVGELVAAVTTFFAQGNQTAVYVLELGDLDTADAITALTNYLVANPNSDYVPGAAGYYYAYVLPSEFDAQPGLLSLLPTYDGTAAKTYFIVTSTLGTYAKYSDLWKDAIVIIPTPPMGTWGQNQVVSVTEQDYSVQAFDIATAQSGLGSYAPGNVLTAAGGTGTEPTFTVTDTLAVGATQNAGGTGTGSGAATFVGTTGTGTKVSGTCTVTSGVMSAPVITAGGDYTANPSSLTAEPVTVTGAGITCTGATITLVMGVLKASRTTAGSLSVLPSNPVATTVSPSGGTGCALTILWTTSGQATATTTTAHGVLPGQWFQLTGFTPTAWNGWWLALTGTTGSTLVFAVPAGTGAVSGEGYLVQNIASSSGEGTTEFQAADVLYQIVSMNPSSTNPARPFQFRYAFGVTPWPRQGLTALQLTLKQAAVNIIKTGAEGGISTAALYWGMTMDGRGILYWYSIDWMAINGQVNVSNAVINGSNNLTNPLFYDQPGIDRLQDVLYNTVTSAISFKLANGQVVKTAMIGTDLQNAINAGQFNGKLIVNAVPFLPYLTASPSDYAAQTYNGLSVLYITSEGFISILIPITVTDFIVQQ